MAAHVTSLAPLTIPLHLLEPSKSATKPTLLMIQPAKPLAVKAAAHREDDATVLPNDLSSPFSQFECRINQMSKWIVSASFCIAILARHDGEALWAIGGSVLNFGFGKFLKKKINQKRPSLSLKTDPGMPSSHAQSIFFILPFLVFSIVQRTGINTVSVALMALLSAIFTYFVWLRVSLRYHSINQTVVGAIIGGSFAVLWHYTWKNFLLKPFASIVLVKLGVLLTTALLAFGFLVHVAFYWVGFALSA